MLLRTLIRVAILAAVFAAPHAAKAGGSWHTKEATIIRVGPGIPYAKLKWLPAGARLKVYHCEAWCEVAWGVYHGWANAKYIVAGEGEFAHRLYISPIEGPGGSTWQPVYLPPQQAYVSSQSFSHHPYDYRPSGRIYYYQGRYLDRPDYASIVVN
jgi:hypothetical protein